MWLVAEGGDASASEKFCQRYPEFRGELHKRMRIVRDLKGARHEKAAAPPFRPRIEAARARPPLRLGTAGAAIAGLAVVALGSYTLTQRLARADDPAPVAPVRSEGSIAKKMMPPPDPPSIVADRSAPPVQADAAHDPAMPESPYTKLIALSARQVPVEVAIKAIGRAAGLRVQIAPGLPSRVVRVEYSGVTGPEALSELGARYGFTAFDQGRAEFLVIPAVDRASAPGEGRPAEMDARANEPAG